MIEQDNDLICPNCNQIISAIECEKTTYCENCEKSWAHDDNEGLREVIDGDDIYLDK